MRLPFEYRLRDIVLTSQGEARRLPAPAFVKPPNDKSFPAAVYTGAALPDGYDASMPVLVSAVVRFVAEFRCFVLDRTVRARSVVSRDGALQREAGSASTAQDDEAVRAFMAPPLADARVDLPRAEVVDLGQLDDGRRACIEANAARGDGLCGCAPAQGLAGIRAAFGPTTPRPSRG